MKPVHNQTSSPLLLLREIRDVMSGIKSVQQKLNKLVSRIAKGFNCEVCSIYFLTPGQMLELHANIGLNKNAVHSARLSIGQGLVGEIAASALSLNLADASSHPQFLHLPETGEDEYHSFAGVPILSAQRVIGVLVVQSKTPKIFSEDEMEVLATVAMVLAELAFSEHLIDKHALALGQHTQSSAYAGQPLSAGLAKAHAILHRPSLEITKLVSESPAEEEARLNHALGVLHEHVDHLVEDAGLTGQGEALEIMEVYRLFLQDKGWLEGIRQAINSGLTAEAAVKKVLEELRVGLGRAQNPHVRQRIEDMEDLSTRLLYQLAGVQTGAARTDLPEKFILVARLLGPADLLEYGHERIKGMVLEGGSSASHTAIIARMLDIPVVAGVKDITSIVHEGDLLVVDGTNGEVYVRPSGEVAQEIDAHIAKREQQDAALEAMRALPPISKDGVRISINLNIGLHLDTQEIGSEDVDGVGLYRTEFPYLADRAFPSVEKQIKIYGEVFRQAKGKPIIFRTFDIGGDKQTAYFRTYEEENPALGWRATRIGLDQPVLLRQQFRALLEAANGEALSIMFPMVASRSEYEACRALFERELETINTPIPSKIRLGMMLEVPSLLFDLPRLLQDMDFISIGSNDLLQFFFAADRGNEHVASRYDCLQPSVMRMFKHITRCAAEANIPAGFCGDMATKPLEAMALFACGFRNLSVPPRAIAPLKAMIASLDITKASEYMEMLCQNNDGSLRKHLKAFAHDHRVVI